MTPLSRNSSENRYESQISDTCFWKCIAHIYVVGNEKLDTKIEIRLKLDMIIRNLTALRRCSEKCPSIYKEWEKAKCNPKPEIRLKFDKNSGNLTGFANAQEYRSNEENPQGLVE